MNCADVIGPQPHPQADPARRPLAGLQGQCYHPTTVTGFNLQLTVLARLDCSPRRYLLMYLYGVVRPSR